MSGYRRPEYRLVLNDMIVEVSKGAEGEAYVAWIVTVQWGDYFPMDNEILCVPVAAGKTHEQIAREARQIVIRERMRYLGEEDDYLAGMEG